MPSPFESQDKESAAWNNWQAMRFLYEDVNSLVLGGGSGFSPFRIDAPNFTYTPTNFNFNLPAFQLPSYISNFKITQGSGSTNVGTGQPNQGGSGGGSVVLPCDMRVFYSAPLSSLVSYIMDQGQFTIDVFISSINSHLRGLMLSNPSTLIVGPVGQLAFYVSASDIHIDYTVPICASTSCINIHDLRLVFRSDAVVYLMGYPNSTSDLRLVYATALWNVGYTLTGSVGSNSFSQSVDWAAVGPPSASGNSVLGTTFGGGVTHSLDEGVSWTQASLTTDYKTSINFLLQKNPTLVSGFGSMLQQAHCL